MAFLFVILSMASLVTGASFAKTLFITFGAESTAVVRLATASLIMFLIWRPWRYRISLKHLGMIFLYGAILGGMNFTFYMAVERLPVGLAVAIEFLGPLAVAIFYSRRMMDWLWVIMASLGVGIILPLYQESMNVSLSGVFFAVIAAVLWALYIIIGRRVAQHVETAIAASYGMVFGFLVVLPFGFGNLHLILQEEKYIGYALLLGLLSSAIPYSLEMLALKKIDPRRFSLLLSLEPAMAALAGYVYIHESLSLIQIMAIILIILASIGSSLSRKAID